MSTPGNPRLEFLAPRKTCDGIHRRVKVSEKQQRARAANDQPNYYLVSLTLRDSSSDAADEAMQDADDDSKKELFVTVTEVENVFQLELTQEVLEQHRQDAGIANTNWKEFFRLFKKAFNMVTLEVQFTRSLHTIQLNVSYDLGQLKISSPIVLDRLTGKQATEELRNVWYGFLDSSQEPQESKSSDDFESLQKENMGLREELTAKKQECEKLRTELYLLKNDKSSSSSSSSSKPLGGFMGDGSADPVVQPEAKKPKRAANRSVINPNRRKRKNAEKGARFG